MDERTTYQVNTAGCLAPLAFLIVSTVVVMAAFWLAASWLLGDA